MLQKIRLTEDDGKKHIIGIYNTDTKEFSTKRHISVHLFRKYNAYGLDKKFVLEHLVRWGATIKITEEPSKRIYRISAEDFVKYGIPISYHQHREQLCVNRKYFK